MWSSKIKNIRTEFNEVSDHNNRTGRGTLEITSASDHSV